MRSSRFLLQCLAVLLVLRVREWRWFLLLWYCSCASARDSSLMGEEMGNEAGLGAAGNWREVRGVVEVELGEVNSRWQYLIRYSVTTACTATPWKYTP